MLTTLLLLVAAGPADATTLMNNAKLQLPTCAVAAGDCAPSRASRYRIVGGANNDPTSKDRAFQADPRPCNLVGAVLCTSHGRPLLSAPINSN